METVVLRLDDVLLTNQNVQGQVSELDELQLAMIGGGCAEVCPY